MMTEILSLCFWFLSYSGIWKYGNFQSSKKNILNVSLNLTALNCNHKQNVHRIFGADEIVRMKKIKRPRSWQEDLVGKMTDKKIRLCKSVESLQDDKNSGSSESLTIRRQFYKSSKTSLNALSDNFSLESEENHLEGSPSGSPASTLSPTTPDLFTAQQSDIPTNDGQGQSPKKRSSSIATTGNGARQTIFPMRWKFKPRRFSVDSQFSRVSRVFLKEKKVIIIDWYHDLIKCETSPPPPRLGIIYVL